MRIVIDLQAAQTEASGRRGVGRYSIALAKAMAEQAGDDEIWIALSGRYAAAADRLRAEFAGLVPPDRIRLFDVPRNSSHMAEGNRWRRRTGELLREAFLADLKPDYLHVSSLFEGLVEDAVTSVKRLDTSFPTGVTLYDLIPLLNAKAYLDRPFVRDWYFDKLTSLKRSDFLMAISESSRREALDHLALPPSQVVNISCAADSIFRIRPVQSDRLRTLKDRHQIRDNFVMYTGGIDFRKNIEGLIAAWSDLSSEIRRTHQLAIVCSIHQSDRERLETLVASQGLAPHEVVFTGYVSEEDLIDLYNSCKLFVFPSLHEGFGLPALEAMACGAPTIGAGNSSIIELLQFRDAMFDAAKSTSIAQKITQSLEDEQFRAVLKDNARKRAAAFSWKTTASLALSAIRGTLPRQARPHRGGAMAPRRPRLAFVSPLPPLETGIADYSAELLPELARHYEVEVVTDQAEITDPWVAASFPKSSVEEFRQDAKRFDRILYHFGNSDFHTHMFDLLESHPGVVVLHDLYLSGVQAWREHHHRQQRHFSRSLAMDHGYGALIEHLEGEPDGAIWTFPVNRQVLQAAMGVIIHSQFNFQRIAGVDVDPSAVACIPLLHAVARPDREAARLRLGLDRDRPLVCTFGGIGKNKHSLLLLRGYADFFRSRNFGGKLVFVGSAAGGAFGEAFEALVEELGIADRIEITGYADPGLYRDYLAAADVAIQLRALTRGETSAAAFDCLAHGIPTVVNAHGPMAEIDDGAVLKLSDDPTAEEVADAFRSLFDSPSLRSEMSRNAVRLVRDHHAPHAIGERYRDAIEAFSTEGSGALRETVLTEAVRDRAYGTASEADLAEFSGCLDLCLSPPPRRTLFIDVSELVHRDWQSGIQRVVKAILSELVRNPPAGFRIEPVFGSIEGDKAIYRAARAFMARFLGQADDDWTNEVVEPANGDVFVGLDLAPTLVPRLCDDGLYTTWRARGVALHFVAYDLLPVLRPEFFIAGAAEDFSRWIEAIARVADSVVCISQAVAIELRDYLSRTSMGREALRIGHFHLGNDTTVPKVTTGEPVPRDASRADRVGGPFVLMVGTLEPRKGHAQAIDAFERLWDEGETTHLVIVARKGWLVDDLVSRITGHRWFGKRLFWFSDIEDAELEELYRGARGLVAASYAEGFGLPLIEAAKRNLPILARDLPVFREVAGAHVTYFERSGAHLSREIGDWLRALAGGDAVAPTGMPILTWAQSTAQLMEAVLSTDGPAARPPVPATAGTVP